MYIYYNVKNTKKLALARKDLNFFYAHISIQIRVANATLFCIISKLRCSFRPMALPEDFDDRQLVEIR